MRLSSESKHGYTKKRQSHNSGENVHMGYAYQWFAFAITLLAIYLIINIKKRNGAT
jgi:cytochrome oxidase assembly protein ShyY1